MTLESKRLSKLSQNYLINGNFPYTQRDSGTPTLDGTSTYHSVDRWKLHVNGTLPTTRRGYRDTVVPTNSKSKYSLRFDAATVAAEHTYVAFQRIESIYARDFLNEVASLSAWVRATHHTQLTLTISY